MEGSGQWLKQQPTINLLTKTSLSVKHLALEKTHCLRKGAVIVSAGRGDGQRVDRVGKNYGIQIY